MTNDKMFLIRHEEVENQPHASVCQIARELSVEKSVVHKTLKSEAYHPYRYTKLQALQEDHFPRQANFCNWLLHQVNENQDFTKHVLWSDEAVFTRNGIFNTNNHYWSTENPHVRDLTGHR
jgi:hypothetical protein